MATNNQHENVQSPGDNDKYIQPIIGKLGWDTDNPKLYGMGYSRDNGLNFHVFVSFDGFIFDRADIDAIWDAGTKDKVKKEVDSATAEIPSAVSNANEAVKRADSAVANSKFNSDAIKAMQSAASEAKAGADKAISDAQAAIKNVASDVEAIRQNVASVEGQVNSAQAANDSQAKAMQADLNKAKQSISDISKNLDKVSANLDTYAKSAAEQGHDITELKNQQGLIEADLASANGNVTQLQATVNELQGNLKDTDSDVASLSATASQAGLALKNAQSQVAQVIARADKFQATIAEQDKKIVDIKATADGASVAASNANSTATEAKLTASAASVTASDAKSDVLTATTTASDAKLLATDAKSQAMEANATASNVSINLSGIEKTANNAASQASVAISKADNNAKQISNVANTVTTVQASVQATQKELSGKVDQATIDSTNKRLEDINAQVSVVAGEVRSKAEQTTVSGISTDLNDLKAKAESIEKDDIDFNDCKSQMNIFSKGPKNAPNDNYWWYLRVEPGTEGRVTQYAVSDRDNHHYTRQFISTSWTPWKETADSNDVANLQAQVDKHSTEISNNTKEIQLKADSQTVNEINQTVQQQQAQQKILADQISSKVSSADVEKMVDGKGFATKDLVESSITQTSGKINETITNLQGNLQNVTADLTGLQSTVRDKADQSQITQLTNVVQSKVSSKDYQTAISQLTDDINAKVAKGDLISQINMEAGQTLIQSKKLFLDADSVVFSGKAFIPDAAIENLSLDKLTAGHITVPIADKYGNQIELGNDGINIISGLVVEDSTNSDSNSSDSNVSDTTTVSTDELTNLAASPATALNTALFIDNQPNNTGTISNQPDNPNSSSSASSSAGSASSGSDSDSFQKIGYGVKLTANGLKMYQHRQYAKATGAEPKSEDFTLLDVNPIKSPVSNDSKKLPEGLAFMIQTQKYSSVLGPETPHNFLALGRRYYKDATDDTGTDFYDVVYSAEDGNGYPVGLHVNAPLYIKPYGADHGIRTVWVSWSGQSGWDGGERYPAIVQDSTQWGGIAFPKSGRVTLFDANGRYYTPDRNTGIGPYNNYGG